MTFKEELESTFANSSRETKILAAPLIDEAVFLKSELDKLKKSPRYKSHPSHPEIIKPLPAFKMYKDLEQQFNITLKNLHSMSVKNGDTQTESPLRKYFKGISND